MPAEWSIRYWPPCRAHAFLSHCAEDRTELVLPVYGELESRQVVPWIDRHHYPLGRDAFEVLREELLASRHVAYFITESFLSQGRGWVGVERGYAATIQQRLRYHDTEVAHVELPLLFVPPDHPLFLRSAWRSLIDKVAVCPIAFDPILGWQKNHIDWASDRIEMFVRQEDRHGAELAERFSQDSRLRKYFFPPEARWRQFWRVAAQRFSKVAASAEHQNLRRRLESESPQRLP